MRTPVGFVVTTFGPCSRGPVSTCVTHEGANWPVEMEHCRWADNMTRIIEQRDAEVRKAVEAEVEMAVKIRRVRNRLAGSDR